MERSDAGRGVFATQHVAASTHRTRLPKLRWLQELSEDVAQRLAQEANENGRACSNLVVGVRFEGDAGGKWSQGKSKRAPLREASAPVIARDALSLVMQLASGRSLARLGVTGMGITAEGFYPLRSSSETSSLKRMFAASASSDGASEGGSRIVDSSDGTRHRHMGEEGGGGNCGKDGDGGEVEEPSSSSAGLDAWLNRTSAPPSAQPSTSASIAPNPHRERPLQPTLPVERDLPDSPYQRHCPSPSAALKATDAEPFQTRCNGDGTDAETADLQAAIAASLAEEPLNWRSNEGWDGMAWDGEGMGGVEWDGAGRDGVREDAPYAEYGPERVAAVAQPNLGGGRGEGGGSCGGDGGGGCRGSGGGSGDGCNGGGGGGGSTGAHAQWECAACTLHNEAQANRRATPSPTCHSIRLHPSPPHPTSPSLYPYPTPAPPHLTPLPHSTSPHPISPT